MDETRAGLVGQKCYLQQKNVVYLWLDLGVEELYLSCFLGHSWYIFFSALFLTMENYGVGDAFLC